MIFKFGMQHGGLGLYKICINGDLGMTLTYFTARSFANLGFSIDRKKWKQWIFQKLYKLPVTWKVVYADN